MSFGKPLSELTFQDVEEYCKQQKEGLTLDFKAEPTDTIEKTACAFANTYGGYIIVGVDEVSDGIAKTPIAGFDDCVKDRS